MKKLNSKGFSVVEGILLVVIVGLVAGVGYYVWKQSKSSPTIENSSASQTTPSTDENAPVAEKDESTEWERFSSGKKGFSIAIPDGWKNVVRVEDSDWFILKGSEQPVYTKGKKATVKDLPSFGSDGPTVFSAIIHDNFAKPKGTSEPFTIAGKQGKKYTYTYSETTTGYVDSRTKGDKDYTYILDLNGDDSLRIFYGVYADDPTDNSELVDKMVRTTQLN